MSSPDFPIGSAGSADTGFFGSTPCSAEAWTSWTIVQAIAMITAIPTPTAHIGSPLFVKRET
jgi:hypothetical protein